MVLESLRKPPPSLKEPRAKQVEWRGKPAEQTATPRKAKGSRELGGPVEPGVRKGEAVEGEAEELARARGRGKCACMLSCSVTSDSLRPHGLQPTRLLCPWKSPGKNTGVGCHALPQGIVPIQGSNSRLR